MRKYTFLSLLLLAVSFLTSNCTKDTENTPPNYDGSWSGTTSQGKSFSFNVSGHEITSIYYKYTLMGNCSSSPSGEQIMFNIPRAITGNSFSIPLHDGSNISGSFSSASKASGSFTKNFTGTAGCSSTASGTWAATK